MERVGVFAGSRDGARPEYREAACELGRELADRRVELVYGAAAIGLMGAVADGALDAGGVVVGILPESLAEREGAHPGLTKLEIVASMHERKAMTVDMASAFIALPGGLGSLEELLEVASWSQLGLHAKPIGVLDVGGFFEPLIELLEHAAAESFVSDACSDLVVADDTPGRLLDRLEARLPAVGSPAPSPQVPSGGTD